MHLTLVFILSDRCPTLWSDKPRGNFTAGGDSTFCDSPFTISCIVTSFWAEPSKIEKGRESEDWLLTSDLLPATSQLKNEWLMIHLSPFFYSTRQKVTHSSDYRFYRQMSYSRFQSMRDSPFWRRRISFSIFSLTGWLLWYHCTVSGGEPARRTSNTHGSPMGQFLSTKGVRKSGLPRVPFVTPPPVFLFMKDDRFPRAFVLLGAYIMMSCTQLHVE